MESESKIEVQKIELKGDSSNELVSFLKALTKTRLSKELPATLKDIQAAYSRFNDRHRFAQGDTVKWKDALKNRRLPLYGEPAVVMDMLSTPVVDSSGDSGSPSFREPLDLVLGVFDGDGDFLTYHFDSRRFQKY